jgi:hypothetical protein
MNAPSTFLATLPGEASVIRNTATDTSSMVSSNRKKRLMINLAMALSCMVLDYCGSDGQEWGF